MAEDEDQLRHAIVYTLKSKGYEIFEAPNGAAALELIVKQKIKLDLVITDIIMPEMGGRSWRMN